VPTISIILLTHATVSHLAAFAHCCKNFPQFSRIPIFATKPVIDLGRTLLQDVYASTPVAATIISRSSLSEIPTAYSGSLTGDQKFLRQPPSPEEIAGYFSKIHELKYSQPHQPQPAPNSPPLNGLTITAYNSGRSLGGTIWHIQHGLESIVYGVDWGQYKENVYSGAAWIGGAHGGGSEVIEQLRKPTALVCSSRSPHVLRPDNRDEQLLATIKACVERGGTVLIPVDSSARVLELAYLLEHAWRKDAGSGLSDAKLYLAGRTVSGLIRHARTLLEWMNEGIVQEFETVADQSKRTNGNTSATKGRDAGPFDFRYLRLLERKAQVERLLRKDEANTATAKVILATDTSLEWGFSRQIFSNIAEDAKNMVILTEVPSMFSNKSSSVARTLWSWWKEKSAGSEETLVDGGGKEVLLPEAKKVALEGAELALYQQWLATQRQLQATLQTGGAAALEGFADAADDVSSDSSSESEGSDDEQQGKALNIAATLAQASRRKVVLNDEDLGITILVKRKGHYDFDVRGKKGRERMFPITARRRRTDDFGDLIRPEEYLRQEEREEDAQDTTTHRRGDQADGLGKKRKWADIGTNPTNSSTANKRPQLSRTMSEDDPERLVGEVNGVLDELDTVEDKDEGVFQGPSKLVSDSTNLAVHLQIAYVDYSGLHTERNLEILLPLVQPRKLILVGGSPEETTTMAAKYRAIVSKNRGIAPEEVDVLCPRLGDSVDASVDTNAWVVKLADPLVKRLKWQNLRGLGIATITGQLLGVAAKRLDESHSTGGDEEGANKRVKTEDENDDAAGSGQDATTTIPIVPTLEVLPTVMKATSRSTAQPLHVGELRLADLRRKMQSSGHTAEFRGEGTLVIDGSVSVKKTTTGRVEVGSVGLPTDPAMKIGGTFYAVRRMIYEGLAVVSGAR
jgi:cleavage and polyadenylation specificity factor subunit 2